MTVTVSGYLIFLSINFLRFYFFGFSSVVLSIKEIYYMALSHKDWELTNSRI